MNILEEIIYPVIDEINESLDEPDKISKSPDTKIFGQNSDFDSIGLVNLVIGIESNIEEKLGISVVLANEQAMSRKNSPFRTLGVLAGYIEELLKEQNSD